LQKFNSKHIAWLIPPAYLIHLLDEHLSAEGLPNWISGVFNISLSTDDFIELVVQRTNSDIGKFVEYFLYTIKLPEVFIEQVSDQHYQVSIPNIDFQLPMNVQTESESKTILLGETPVNIISASQPVVDEKNWYLKNIRVENITAD